MAISLEFMAMSMRAHYLECPASKVCTHMGLEIFRAKKKHQKQAADQGPFSTPMRMAKGPFARPQLWTRNLSGTRGPILRRNKPQKRRILEHFVSGAPSKRQRAEIPLAKDRGKVRYFDSSMNTISSEAAPFHQQKERETNPIRVHIPTESEKKALATKLLPNMPRIDESFQGIKKDQARMFRDLLICPKMSKVAKSMGEVRRITLEKLRIQSAHLRKANMLRNLAARTSAAGTASGPASGAAPGMPRPSPFPPVQVHTTTTSTSLQSQAALALTSQLQRNPNPNTNQNNLKQQQRRENPSPQAYRRPGAAPAPYRLPSPGVGPNNIQVLEKLDKTNRLLEKLMENIKNVGQDTNRRPAAGSSRIKAAALELESISKELLKSTNSTNPIADAALHRNRRAASSGPRAAPVTMAAAAAANSAGPAGIGLPRKLTADEAMMLRALGRNGRPEQRHAQHQLPQAAAAPKAQASGAGNDSSMLFPRSEHINMVASSPAVNGKHGPQSGHGAAVSAVSQVFLNQQARLVQY